MRSHLLRMSLLVALVAPTHLFALGEASLRGSPASMREQNEVAKDLGLSFYRSGSQIRNAVATGELVRLQGNENYEVSEDVSYPFVQPAAALFVERVSAEYRQACGQKLVVTSGVRPISGQPANAHELSVHPAGMAVDLRVSDRASCRSWLETTILALEEKGLVNGVREFRPPHYHVAIFPIEYLAYVEERVAEEVAEKMAREAAALSALPQAPVMAAGVTPSAPGKERSLAEAVGLAVLALAGFGPPIGFTVARRKVRQR